MITSLIATQPNIFNAQLQPLCQQYYQMSPWFGFNQNYYFGLSQIVISSLAGME